MVPPGGHFECVVEVVPQNEPLDLDPVLVGTGGGAHLGEEGRALGEPRGGVPHELAQEEAVVNGPVRLEVVDVGKTQDVDVQGGLGPGRIDGSGTDRDQRDDEREDSDRLLLRDRLRGVRGRQPRAR